MQIFNCDRGVHKREVVGIDKLRTLPAAWYAFTNLDLALGPGKSRELDVIMVVEDRILLLDLKDWAGKIESQGGRWLHRRVDFPVSFDIGGLVAPMQWSSAAGGLLPIAPCGLTSL